MLAVLRMECYNSSSSSSDDAFNLFSFYYPAQGYCHWRSYMTFCSSIWSCLRVEKHALVVIVVYSSVCVFCAE